jgi:hypothetical protein
MSHRRWMITCGSYVCVGATGNCPIRVAVAANETYLPQLASPNYRRKKCWRPSKLGKVALLRVTSCARSISARVVRGTLRREPGALR